MIDFTIFSSYHSARKTWKVYGELYAPQPDIGEKQHRLAALVFRLNLSREGRKREGIAADLVNILEKTQPSPNNFKANLQPNNIRGELSANLA